MTTNMTINTETAKPSVLVEIFVITPVVVAITYVLYLGFERPFVKRRILLDTK